MALLPDTTASITLIVKTVDGDRFETDPIIEESARHQQGRGDLMHIKASFDECTNKAFPARFKERLQQSPLHRVSIAAYSTV